MSKNLLAILALYTPFEPEDYRLPVAVLLNLHRATLRSPLQALDARIREGSLEAEAVYLCGLDKQVDEFHYRATRTPANHAAREAIWMMWAGARYGEVPELYRVNEAFSSAGVKGGMNGGFLFEYLTGLSLDPRLHQFVDVMDPYLEGLPELIAGRYVPQAAL